MQNILPIKEERGLGQQNLTPHAHLQLSQRTPLQQRLAQVSKLFQSHPILSQKTARIKSLAADRPIENKIHVAHLSRILLNEEKPLWQSVKIDPSSIIPRTSEQKDLSDEEKKYVEIHCESVRKISPPSHFAPLLEYALISNESRYNTAHQDYQRFMATAGAAEQISAMQEILEQQHLMLRKLDSRLMLDAHRVTPLIAELRESFENQQVIAARLPKFEFR